jgi:anoctamin-10
MIVQLLVNHGANLHHHPKGENNALHWACYYGNKTLVYYLLETDAKLLYKPNSDDLYPIDYLFFENKPNCYKFPFLYIFP